MSTKPTTTELAENSLPEAGCGSCCGSTCGSSETAAAVETLQLLVPKMDCPNEERSIRAAVEQVPGVLAAT